MFLLKKKHTHTQLADFVFLCVCAFFLSCLLLSDGSGSDTFFVFYFVPKK